eukprot:m.542920 g.542920  ORF g.542920 m.542920 type:complete len:295 (+) comp57664_c0_seq4:421-1305(+)
MGSPKSTLSPLSAPPSPRPHSSPPRHSPEPRAASLSPLRTQHNKLPAVSTSPQSIPSPLQCEGLSGVLSPPDLDARISGLGPAAPRAAPSPKHEGSPDSVDFRRAVLPAMPSAMASSTEALWAMVEEDEICAPSEPLLRLTQQALRLHTALTSSPTHPDSSSPVAGQLDSHARLAMDRARRPDASYDRQLSDPRHQSVSPPAPRRASLPHPIPQLAPNRARSLYLHRSADGRRLGQHHVRVVSSSSISAKSGQSEGRAQLRRLRVSGDVNRDRGLDELLHLAKTFEFSFHVTDV